MWDDDETLAIKLKKFQNLRLEAHSHALNSDFLPFLENVK